MTGEAGRQDTVKNIDAACHPVDQIFGCTDPHQVARFVFRQERNDYIKRIVHLLFGLAHGESANGDTGRIERRDKSGRVSPQVRLNAALYDPE